MSASFRSIPPPWPPPLPWLVLVPELNQESGLAVSKGYEPTKRRGFNIKLRKASSTGALETVGRRTHDSRKIYYIIMCFTRKSYAAIMRATSNVSFPLTGQDGTSSNGQDLR
ncbi:hypothetical protein OPV22_007895 [Ensete ventricosum]|uniref:Uncharacterized protein n=1 Tax=Ensete ventricosum TaxID=4639 RepID=A0AAV8RC41_ENSVE|nr:hypothetical protein OPV22_007895 [Ensete ventricosum]